MLARDGQDDGERASAAAAVDDSGFFTRQCSCARRKSSAHLFAATRAVETGWIQLPLVQLLTAKTNTFDSFEDPD